MKQRVFSAVAGGVLAAVVLAGSAYQTQAFELNNLFRFEFYEGGPKIIGTDTHGHYNDFRHNNDYYVTHGFVDEHAYTSCREYRTAGGDRQIRCVGRDGDTGSVPGR